MDKLWNVARPSSASPNAATLHSCSRLLDAQARASYESLQLFVGCQGYIWTAARLGSAAANATVCCAHARAIPTPRHAQHPYRRLLADLGNAWEYTFQLQLTFAAGLVSVCVQSQTCSCLPRGVSQVVLSAGCRSRVVYTRPPLKET